MNASQSRGARDGYRGRPSLRLVGATFVPFNEPFAVSEPFPHQYLAQASHLSFARHLVRERAGKRDASQLVIALGDVRSLALTAEVGSSRRETQVVVAETAEVLPDVLKVDGLDRPTFSRFILHGVVADCVVDGPANDARWVLGLVACRVSDEVGPVNDHG